MTFSKYVSRVSLLIVFVFAAFVTVAPARAWNGDPPPAFDWGAISVALQNLVLATLPVLAAFIARWLNSKYQNERAKLNERQLYLLDTFIRTAVYAAEQMKVFEYADSKLDYVTILVEGWLYDHNITMDMGEIRARIEAAVKQEFPKPPAEG